MSPTPRTLEDWLAPCERPHTVGLDMGVGGVGAGGARAGVTLGTPLGQEPVDGAPVVFTVAGTNGKGSTCAMLESILIASGFRVGVYGSPHPARFGGRRRLNGQLVKADELLPHFEAIEAARGDRS